jgi:hypothetical protein
MCTGDCARVTVQASPAVGAPPCLLAQHLSAYAEVLALSAGALNPKAAMVQPCKTARHEATCLCTCLQGPSQPGAPDQGASHRHAVSADVALMWRSVPDIKLGEPGMAASPLSSRRWAMRKPGQAADNSWLITCDTTQKTTVAVPVALLPMACTVAHAQGYRACTPTRPQSEQAAQMPPPHARTRL